MGFWSSIATSVMYAGPILLIYLVGIVMASLYVRVNGRASVFLLVGFLLQLVSLVGGVLIQAWLMSRPSAAATMGSGLAIAGNVVTIAGISLVIAGFVSAVAQQVANGPADLALAHRVKCARQAFVLGILGVVLFSPLGILAWSMAAEPRTISPEAAADTKTRSRMRWAKGLGIVATVFFCLQIVAGLVILFVLSHRPF